METVCASPAKEHRLHLGVVNRRGKLGSLGFTFSLSCDCETQVDVCSPLTASMFTISRITMDFHRFLMALKTGLPYRLGGGNVL